jgi:hypothetical protein
VQNPYKGKINDFLNKQKKAPWKIKQGAFFAKVKVSY